MEAQDETMGSTQMIIKGKRTKRPLRPPPQSPLSLTMASTSSEGAGVDCSSDNSDAGSIGLDVATRRGNEEEEEVMANCLILLSKGSRSTVHCGGSTRTRKQPDPTTETTGSNPYQCKTCLRCFPSFQALGGHRASHKKFKLHNPDDQKKNPSMEKSIQESEDHHHHHRLHQFQNETNSIPTSTVLSLQISDRAPSINNGGKSKVHECSICGAEFTSGQALGGHMRRHRTMAMASSASASSSIMSSPEGRSQFQAKLKQRNKFSLDLNLPAPEDDDHHHTQTELIPFAPKGQVIVFSASPLVDCHY